MVQTLPALAYLQRRGIMHHDLKPGNMLVSAGRVRGLNFGLSLLPDQVRRSDGQGTLLYLDSSIPPVARNSVSCTSRSCA